MSLLSLMNLTSSAFWLTLALPSLSLPVSACNKPSSAAFGTSGSAGPNADSARKASIRDRQSLLHSCKPTCKQATSESSNSHVNQGSRLH